MVAICLFNELRGFAFVYIPDGEYIINISFPGEWILSALILNLWFYMYLSREDVGKSNKNVIQKETLFTRVLKTVIYRHQCVP